MIGPGLGTRAPISETCPGRTNHHVGRGPGSRSWRNLLPKPTSGHGRTTGSPATTATSWRRRSMATSSSPRLRRVVEGPGRRPMDPDAHLPSPRTRRSFTGRGRCLPLQPPGSGSTSPLHRVLHRRSRVTGVPMHPYMLHEVLVQDRRRELLATASARRLRERERLARTPLHTAAAAWFRSRVGRPGRQKCPAAVSWPDL